MVELEKKKAPALGFLISAYLGGGGRTGFSSCSKVERVTVCWRDVFF